MSWSVQLVGVPEKIAAELDAYEATLTGQSQVEFQEAKPHLQGLIRGNVGQFGLLQLNAGGHATINNGEKTYGTVVVTLQTMSGKVCV